MFVKRIWVKNYIFKEVMLIKAAILLNVNNKTLKSKYYCVGWVSSLPNQLSQNCQ